MLCLRKLHEAQDGEDKRGVEQSKMLKVLVGSVDTLVEALRNH